MKLKVKATSETLEVAPGSYICGLHPNGNEVEFLAEDVEIIPNDWDAFRREAAKDFISGMLANVSPAAEQWTTPEIVTAALDIADELIKQLKQE